MAEKVLSFTGVRRIAIAAMGESEILDLAGPLSVFDTANRFFKERSGGRDAYRTELISVVPDRVVTCVCGVSLNAHRYFKDVPGGIDTLLVTGGFGVARLHEHRDYLNWVKTVGKDVRRLGSVCAGAVVLAAAGFLDGRRATTHWRWCDEIASHFPAVEFDPDPIFIQDGHVYTSAGVTAGIDLALALVEEDLGAELALDVARNLVVFLRRPGGQSQFSVALSQQFAELAPLRKLHGWILEHLEEPLTVEFLADRVGMSPRNFARVFARQTGTTPARFVMNLRVEAARRRLEESDQTVERIAAECGFGTTEAMRGAFQRILHVSPQDYRKRFQAYAAYSTSSAFERVSA